MRRLVLLTRQLHVISRSKTSIIKPSCPTPQNLKQYNLPSHDRMTPNYYIPAIFFYANINNSADHAPILSNLLKNSLSETLSKYYPFAGRLRPSGSTVDCNDEGVQFVEAQLGCKLSDAVERAPTKEDEEGLGRLFPPHIIYDNFSDDKYSSLMVVQLNHFTCGGIAIAVSLSHRIGDALTLFSFVTYWANLSCHSGDHQKVLHLRPHFVYELLPQSHDDGSITANVLQFPGKHWITKEIVFHNSSIAKLKADMEDKLQDNAKLNCTRNELVTALLYRCAAAASNSGTYAKSVLCQVVNMRPMIDPPLPQTSLGNFINYNIIPTSTENETGIKFLVKQIREGKTQLRGSKSLDLTTALTTFLEFTKGNFRIYFVSSICNLPQDELDFGWGRPVKATIVDLPAVNYMMMMDTATGDGIKVLVGLEEQDMKNFLANRELITYTSF